MHYAVPVNLTKSASQPPGNYLCSVGVDSTFPINYVCERPGFGPITAFDYVVVFIRNRPDFQNVRVVSNFGHGIQRRRRLLVCSAPIRLRPFGREIEDSETAKLPMTNIGTLRNHLGSIYVLIESFDNFISREYEIPRRASSVKFPNIICKCT